jgi:hypothetical protein
VLVAGAAGVVGRAVVNRLGIAARASGRFRGTQVVSNL